MEAVLIRAGMVPGASESSISVAAPRPAELAIPVPSADSTGGATADNMGAHGSVPPVSLRTGRTACGPPTSAVIDRVGGRAGYRADP